MVHIFNVSIKHNRVNVKHEMANSDVLVNSFENLNLVSLTVMLLIQPDTYWSI